MKQTQRDIKYIIKRILIGVGIAIILFNLKKCNVYAYSNEYYLRVNNSGVLYQYTEIGTNFRDTGESFVLNDNLYHIVYRYDGTYIQNNVKPIYIVQAYNNISYISMFYIPNNYTFNNNTFFSLSRDGNGFPQFPPNYYLYEDNTLFCIMTDSGSNSCKNKINNNFGIFGDNPYYYASMYNNISILNTQIDTGSPLNQITYTNTTFANMWKNNVNNISILSNSPIPVKYGTSDIIYNPTPPDPLANYTQLDLTGYQAVLLVPKDYQTMLSDSSHTNENPPGIFRTYLDLEYYSQECVRGTLINVENVQDIMLNNIGVGTGNLAESVTGTCYQEATQTIMSYEFDQYSGLKARGLLVYNGSQDWQSGFGTETPFFGTSYVWYDPNLYNAYLVESFDNFNQTISYKDYSGENQEVTIESLPTFTESMENAIENVDSPTPTEVNKQKLQAIFNFLKTPFSFLNKLNTTSCSPIDLPFPRSNQVAHIECLSSSVYNRYLPSALKSIIVIIINGLLFYRCTLSNIDIFTNILDPEDNKLEAIQL